MRVLIISAEVWRDDTNGGNVLTNLIGSLDAEVAQIFCNPGEPQNNICKKYYQMTDGMVMRSALRHRPIGRCIEYDDFPTGGDKDSVSADQPNKRMYSFSTATDSVYSISPAIFFGIRQTGKTKSLTALCARRDLRSLLRK